MVELELQIHVIEFSEKITLKCKSYIVTFFYRNSILLKCGLRVFVLC